MSDTQRDPRAVANDEMRARARELVGKIAYMLPDSERHRGVVEALVADALQSEYERGKRETAAKCAEICDSAAKSCLEWTKCDRSGCTCSACSEQRSMAGACREAAREIRAAFGLDEKEK